MSLPRTYMTRVVARLLRRGPQVAVHGGGAARAAAALPADLPHQRQAAARRLNHRGEATRMRVTSGP